MPNLVFILSLLTSSPPFVELSGRKLYNFMCKSWYLAQKVKPNTDAIPLSHLKKKINHHFFKPLFLNIHHTSSPLSHTPDLSPLKRSFSFYKFLEKKMQKQLIFNHPSKGPCKMESKEKLIWVLKKKKTLKPMDTRSLQMVLGDAYYKNRF